MLKALDKTSPIAYVSVLILLVSAALAVGAHMALWDNIWGDTIVHFQYARNLARGYWFEYNAGEPSSGSTSPLWSIILGGLYRLLIGTGSAVARTETHLYPAVRLLSAALWIATLPLLFDIGQWLSRSRRVAGAAVVMWGGSAVAAFWSTTGMETMLYTALTLLLVWGLAGLIQVPARMVPAWLWLIAISAGLLPLVRPEGFGLAGLGVRGGALVLLRWRPDLPLNVRIRLIFACAACFFALALPYYLINWARTGTMWPSSGLSRVNLARLAADVRLGPTFISEANWSVVLPQAIPLAVGVLFLVAVVVWPLRLVVAAERERQLICGLILTWTTINLIYYNLLSGFSSHRYYLSVLPFVYLAAALVLETLLGQMPRLQPWMPRLGTLVLVSLFLWTQWPVLQAQRSFIQSVPSRFFPAEAQWLAANTGASDVVLAYEAQIAYYADRPVLSLDGIVDGKVLSELVVGNDLYQFVDRYRPRYYLAYVNDVRKHPLWRQTIFRPLEEFNASLSSAGDSFQVDSIRFMKMAPNIYRIEYAQPLPAAATSCAGKSWQMQYQAESLPSLAPLPGQADSLAANGQARQADPNLISTETALVYGPYLQLLPGQYEAVFLIRSEGTSPPPGGRVAVLEVAQNMARSVLLELSAHDVSGTYSEFRLPFRVQDLATSLELRIFYHPGIKLWVDSVNVIGCLSSR